MYILIETVSELDQLYNYQHLKYHLRVEKLKSIEKIRNIRTEKGNEVTATQITGKLLSLRI